MLRAAPMLHLDVLLLAQDERTVLGELGRRGAVELIRADGASGTRAEDLARCTSLLDRIAKLAIPHAPAMGPSPDPAAQDLDVLEARLRVIEDEASALREQYETCARCQAAAAGLRDRLTGFEDLALPDDLPGRSAFLHYVLGTLPDAGLEALRQEAGAAALVMVRPRNDGLNAVVAVTPRRNGPDLDRAARAAGLQVLARPASPADTAALLTTTGAELEALAGKQAAFVTKSAAPLAELEASLRAEQRMLEAGQELAHTAATARLTGWIPVDEAERAEQRIRERTRDRCVVKFTAPATADAGQVPVLLRTPRWLEPFIALVAAYGHPAYGELAPTLFLAVTYLVMFGLMFGDVGHGAVLALGGLALHRLVHESRLRSAGLLLLYAGTSSMVFGLVYGSCFGLPALHRFALWRDPIEGDPLPLMLLAVGFGIAVISLGLVLNIVNRLGRGDLTGGLLDKFGLAGLAFYWGALALVAKGSALAAEGLLGRAVVVLVLVPMACWLLKEPLDLRNERRAHGGAKTGSLAMAWAESAVGAFEGVLTFLANTISFVRLAAYAMSHAALLLAFFLMADAVRDSTATGGVLIVVAGNLLVIVLEGIIAAVQALRLEYYEFFGKFYAGTGRPFRPFVLWSPSAGG